MCWELHSKYEIENILRVKGYRSGSVAHLECHPVTCNPCWGVLCHDVCGSDCVCHCIYLSIFGQHVMLYTYLACASYLAVLAAMPRNTNLITGRTVALVMHQQYL